MQHGRMVMRIMEVLKLTKRYVMENPAGGMERMWYMLDWEDKKKVIEMFAFVWPFKKTTNLWANLGFDWQPKGTTGDGRCGEACGQGAVDPVTKRFRHFMALAVDPQRGPRGANAVKMTCGIPQLLVTELLEAVNEAEGIENKVVLDLCAGFQSLMSAPARCYVWCTARGGRSHAFLPFHAYLQHHQLAVYLHPAPCTLNSIPRSSTSPMHMHILLCAAL